MKYLVFGEILIDRIEGKDHPGGAALNFSAHLSRLRNEVFLVSAIGKDNEGKFLLDSIRDLKLSEKYLRVNKQKSTGLSVISLNQEALPSYEIVKDSAWDNISLSSEILESITSESYDCFYFGALAQRNRVSRNSLLSLVDKIKVKYFFCDLNLRNDYYDKDIIINSLERADILKINIEEYRVINRLVFKEELAENEFFEMLQKDYQTEILIISKGSKGVSVFSSDKHIVLEAVKTKVIDTVGAGDSFSAAFLDKYLRTGDLEEATKVANLYASRVVAQHGAF